MQASRWAWQRAEPLRAQLCAASAAAAAVRAQPPALRRAAAVRSRPGTVWCSPVRGPCPSIRGHRPTAAAAVTLRGHSGAPAAVRPGAVDCIVPADRRRWRLCRTGSTVPAAAEALCCRSTGRRICRCAHVPTCCTGCGAPDELVVPEELLIPCMSLLISLLIDQQMTIKDGGAAQCRLPMWGRVGLLILDVCSGGQVRSSTSLQASTRRSRHSRVRTAICRLPIPSLPCNRGRAGTPGKDSCAMT